MASRRLPFILAMAIESAGWQANSAVGDTQGYPRDEHCQSAPARIYPWRKRRSRAPSIAPGAFFVAQSWADCITNMAGFNLRQAQRLAPDERGGGPLW